MLEIKNDNLKDGLSSYEQVQDRANDVQEVFGPKFPLIECRFGNSSVSVCPDRGGTIPSLILGGVEIFYNDSDRREDLHQNIREGFWMGPVAGKLPQETQESLGTNLKQHGFLRDIAREIQSNENGVIIMEYTHDSSKEGFEDFPYACKLVQKIQIDETSATCSLDIRNLDSKVLPFAPGHHTYFQVAPDVKNDIMVDLKLKLSYDNIKEWVSGTSTIKSKNNPGSIEVLIPGKGKYRLTYSDLFDHLWFWSELDKGFVCIEPVVAHPSEFTSKALQIQPGETKSVEFKIEVFRFYLY